GDRPAHRGVGLARVALRLAFAGVAPIVLDVIGAPGGVLPRVLEFVALAARPAGAGLLARVAVDAELQPACVEIVAELLHARGEALRIGLDHSVLNRKSVV